MTKLDLKGIIPPLTTPFTQRGAIYEESLRRLLDFHLEKGTHAFFMCGTYGAGPLMSAVERKRVTEITVDQVNGKIPVLIHVGTPSTAQTLDLARHSQDTGADAVAAVPPFYFAHDEQAVLHHFQALVEAVDIPVFVYNNPRRTGITIRPELLVKLIDLGIYGMKDSSFSFITFTHFLIAVGDRPDFTFVIGTGDLCMPGMLVGAKACISGVGNVFPEIMIDLYDAVRNKNYDEATILQLKVIRANQALNIPSSPYAACYAALALRGLEVGIPKPPLLPILKEDKQRMKAAFIQLGLL